MSEDTFYIVKGMLESGMTYEEIISKKKISEKSVQLIDESKTPEECNSKYYSNKGKLKGKKAQKTSEETLTEQMNTLIDLVRELVTSLK